VTELPIAAERGDAGLRSDLAVAGAVFVGALVLLLGVFVGSALLLAGENALWSSSGPVRFARFCMFLCLVTAYIAASVVLLRRGAAKDFAALRPRSGTNPAQWQSWARRFGNRRDDAIAAAIGALVGLAINEIGSLLAAPDEILPWRGLFWWSALLNALLFACLALLARWSLVQIGALRAIGRVIPISLLDTAAFAPFVRAGLRAAIAWLVGSSLALTLVIDVSAPWIVFTVVGGTMALGVAALLLPSVGLNERLRAEKARELAWVRAEIALAREALARSDAASRESAARLPLLLAWESRVADAGTWPFDAPTLVRFSLLLLVPLGSWFGGALVDRFVDTWLGR
jgi:hypothetical protein